MKLGRIESVDIRNVWRNEATEFTPWLARPENISALGEALHLGELTLEATEQSVGDFSADIVAVDDAGSTVLIENQLEQTDHRHLGQVLTYLAGVSSGEASIVWVASRFREEHRAAIDWLNQNTIDGFAFFGVELEVLRIGDSAPAPRFNLVAMPNDWAKQARQTVRRASSDAPSELKAQYQKYWRALKALAVGDDERARFPKPWARLYLPFPVGRSGFQISAVICRADSAIRVELYMRQKGIPENQAFDALFAERAAIESDYGAELDWQSLDARVAARVATYLPNADIDDEADWPRQHRWIIQQVSEFRRVFSQRVKQLKLADVDDSDDVAD